MSAKSCLMVMLSGFCVLASFSSGWAQPTIISSVPANGATDVPTTTMIVLTFSTAMNPTATSPLLYDDNFTIYPTAVSWSAGNTVLTCQPGSAFPSDTRITWVVTGQSAGGQPLGGIPAGVFTTAGTGSFLLLTNSGVASGNFHFDVLCSSGQTVTVEHRTNLAVGQWQWLLTTNSPGSSFRVVVPQVTSQQSRFFRARDGS